MDNDLSLVLLVVQEGHLVDGAAHVELGEESFELGAEQEKALEVTPVEISKPILLVVEEDEALSEQQVVLPLGDDDLAIIGDEDAGAVALAGLDGALVDPVAILLYFDLH